MTYRAWEQKPLDRTAVRELTAAIAEQAAAQLEEQAMDEAPWSDEKYKAVLAAQQKENALLAGILAARGITDPAEALTLLAGEEELSDPALLTDMDAACQRIWQAIDNGETIAVFGDYDVDGVTATALLYQHLKGMGATVKCMLPSREGDGYGLSKNAIQSMHNKGCTLIVTVDNGISAVEEADFAASLGTLFAAVYFRTGNLWVTVFLHGAMDISSMLIGGLYGTTTVAEAVSGYDASMLLSVLLYLIPTAFLLRRKKLPEVQLYWHQYVKK